MLTIRAMAAAAVFAGTIIAAAPALASCDSIYNNTCKPIPAKDPEPAAEPEKVSKPLQINARRLASRKARAERSAQKERKRYARSVTTTRVFVLRQRRAKAMAAVPRERIKPAAIEDDVEPSPPPIRGAKATRRVVTAADPGATSGESTDVNAAADVLRPQPVVTVPVASPVANSVEQARPAPTASPAPIPVRTVAQNEVNEIDLAAAAAAGPDPADQSWIRTLVLAFGGLLAVGSALRLFL